MSYTASKPIAQLVAWVQCREGEIKFRDRDVLVKVRMGGTIRQVARPTFGLAVERLMEMDNG